MDFGYARVSTEGQNLDHQIDALTRAGIPRDRIYVDKVSGTKASRPEWDILLRTLREGDTLYATRIDRFGRSLKHLVLLGEDLKARKINLKVTEQGIDTTTSEGRLLFGMLAVLAEFYRDLIVANTKDGLEAARARGRVGGRKPSLSPRQAQLARDMYAETDADGKRLHTVQQIADQLKVSRTTVYNYIGEASA
jgi:DNA invertase Pin-like site-specific DNA recombinase